MLLLSGVETAEISERLKIPYRQWKKTRLIFTEGLKSEM